MAGFLPATAASYHRHGYSRTRASVVPEKAAGRRRFSAVIEEEDAMAETVVTRVDAIDTAPK
jgi:hypothetical protein